MKVFPMAAEAYSLRDKEKGYSDSCKHTDRKKHPERYKKDELLVDMQQLVMLQG